MNAQRQRILAVCSLSALLAVPASADKINFDVSGKLYTKWLYRNNDSSGVLSLGNPFWPDNMAGDNGVGTEFELNILGNVGDHVKAGVRIKSRFGALWQDWWENGDIAYDQENTSGESLGMNRSQYMKLRGYWIQAQLPIPYLHAVHVGSSDFGMFDPWSIGKIRYIDRDNGKGIFVQGAFSEEYFRFHGGVIALPKLWVGPNWSTGVGDPLLRTPFYSRDWAYGLKLESDVADGVNLKIIGTFTHDAEIDLTDPDAVGSKYPDCTDELGNHVPGCAPNGAVDDLTRYANAVVTGTLGIDADGGSFEVFGAMSYSDINEDLAGNGVFLNDGTFPLVYDDTLDVSIRARAEFYDLADGLNLKLEYFNVGEHFQTIFGARREADVLWTDGFVEGGQLPTLNLANEFVDFDEDWYESVVGWHGATAIFEYSGDLELSLEGTFITYNTNAQSRAVLDRDNPSPDSIYPDFLHTDGYTDTDLYDYANVFDRGRDLRAVYRRHQDRMSAIGVLKGVWHTGAGEGLDIGFKTKIIYDSDKRFEDSDDDDYLGIISNSKLWLSYPAADGLDLQFGSKIQYWKEDRRRGSLAQGYGDDTTFKAVPYLDLSYNYEGFAARYRLEYVYKDQQREREDDQTFHVIRSKATVEVSW